MVYGRGAMSSDGPPAYNLANHYAEDLRWAGRQLVLAQKYEEAMEKYTEAITAFTRSGFEMGVGVCLTNRAIVAAKLGWWAESYCDAKLGARHFPKFAKAWFRAAMALEKLEPEPAPLTESILASALACSTSLSRVECAKQR